MAAGAESPVASPAPGWARRLPADEKLFLWLIAGSVLLMTLFVVGWLAWGKQNVPTTYKAVTPAQFSEQVSKLVERYQGADGRVYVPAGADAYLQASRYTWYPELVLQAHTKYRIWMSSADTLHGFSLVGGGQNINLELSPNHATGAWITVGGPGKYLIVCNEFCGLGHQTMKGYLTVMAPAELKSHLVRSAPAETTPSGGAPAGALALSADPSGALRFDKTALEAAAGGVTITMSNPSPLPHNVAIKGNGVDVKGRIVTTGGTSTVTADLKPGTYTFYCTVPGHEAAGMKGTLTVS